jgi:hypothetical protein
MNTTPQSENPYASPLSEEAPVVSNPTPAWRDGELVVVAPDGELSRRCAKCGREAYGPMHYAFLKQPEPMSGRRGALIAVLFVLAIVVVPNIAGILRSAKTAWPNWLPTINSQHLLTLFMIGVAIAITWFQFVLARQRRPKSLRYSLCWWHHLATRFSQIVLSLTGLAWMFVVAFDILLDGLSRFVPIYLLLMFWLAIAALRITFTAKEVARRNGYVWLKSSSQEFLKTLPAFPPELAIKDEQEH